MQDKTSEQVCDKGSWRLFLQLLGGTKAVVILRKCVYIASNIIQVIESYGFQALLVLSLPLFTTSLENKAYMLIKMYNRL